MKTPSIATFATLALVVNASVAADQYNSATPLTRAEVKKSVLEARAAGELTVGDVPNYPFYRPETPRKGFKRKAEGATPTDSAATAAETRKP